MDYVDLIILPEEDEPEAAFVLVPVEIAGLRKEFLLDTGAATTCVVLHESNASLQSEGSVASSTVFTDGQHDIITVPNLTIGPINKTRFPVARTTSADPRLKNLIGMDLLKDYRCQFNFDENRLYLQQNDEAGSAETYPTQRLLVDSKYHIYVDVLLGDISAKAVWDTGASLTIVDVNFIENHPELFTKTGDSKGIDGAGHSMETPMFVMNEVEIAGTTFPKCRVAGVDLSRISDGAEIPFDMILGYNTICSANWFFDFPRLQWAIIQ